VSFCQKCEREHQPRDHAVPCHVCRVATLDPHGLCAICAHDAWQERQDEIGDRLVLKALEERDS